VTNRAAFEDSTIQEFLRQIAPVRSELDLNNLKDNRESAIFIPESIALLPKMRCVKHGNS